MSPTLSVTAPSRIRVGPRSESMSQRCPVSWQRWRWSFHPEPKDAPGQQMGFVPARVVPDSCVTPDPVAPASSGGAIEIEFAAGVRMRITGAVDAATLKAAGRALAGGGGG